MNTSVFHRTNAALLGLFVLSHLCVHLFALAGPDAHAAALDAVRRFYRHPVLEGVLVASILLQVVTGASRLRFKAARGWALAQALSGAYILFFLSVHTSAALYTHHIFGLDTDFYWAAGSLHFTPIRFAFALYYFLAVVAVFTHIGAAIRFNWPSASARIPLALPMTGAIIAGLIVSAFSGAFFEIEIPDDVRRYYAESFGELAGSPDEDR